jgi:hypothetical protein
MGFVTGSLTSNTRFLLVTVQMGRLEATGGYGQETSDARVC